MRNSKTNCHLRSFFKTNDNKGSEASPGVNYGKWFIFMLGLGNYDKCSRNKDKTFNCNRGTIILETDNSICVVGGRGGAGGPSPAPSKIHQFSANISLFVFVPINNSQPSKQRLVAASLTSEVARSVTTGWVEKDKLGSGIRAMKHKHDH